MISANTDIVNYNRFINETMDFESDELNFKFDFNILTRKYGKAYISYISAAWAANDNILTVEEFCNLNGEIPMQIFNKLITQ